jgi:predicted ferric reductase
MTLVLPLLLAYSVAFPRAVRGVGPRQVLASLTLEALNATGEEICGVGLVAWGLLLSTGVGDAWIAIARSIDVHRWISAVALGLVAAHGLVLLGDPYVRFDALDLLVPFVSAYRPLAVGLGLLAAYGAVAVFGSFWLRRRIGQRTWRPVHYLAFPTLGLVTLHGLLAGTDSATSWMRMMYLVISAIIIWLSVYRVVATFARRMANRLSPDHAAPTPMVCMGK